MEELTRVTVTIRITLREFLEHPGTELYGHQISRNTGVCTGTLYPILTRLAASGWLSPRREDSGECQESRPLRTYYRLTAEGSVAAAALLVRRPLP